MMSIVDPITIDVERPRIDSGYSLGKEFTKVMHINFLLGYEVNKPSKILIKTSSTTGTKNK